METLERGDTTISDREVFPQGSRPQNTWRRRVLHCFSTSAEESLEAKSVLSLLRSGERRSKCQGPQKAQGKRRGRAQIPRSSVSILGDIDRYLLMELISITQATTKTKTHYRNLSIDHMPRQGGEGCTETCIQAKTLVPTPVFVSKRCSTCGSACHTQGRALPKLHAQAGGIRLRQKTLMLLRLMDVFQEKQCSLPYHLQQLFHSSTVHSRKRN